MSIPGHIFKGYDIRGIYPTEINEENIVPIIKAIFLFLSKDKPKSKTLTIVVGTDMRLSSPSLTKVAIKTLVELGVKVIEIGMVSTPTFYFVVHHFGYNSGIQITASHNPKEWNGIKIVKRGSLGLIKIGKPTGLEEIKKMALEGVSVKPKNKGFTKKIEGFLEEEVNNGLKISGNPNFRRFKIVADAANAMGSQYIDALFRKIPGELVRMNFELDGSFPIHQPDPLQKETLVDLRKKVILEKADLGLAPDGDGDRLFFIDEKGTVVPPTIITSIVAKEFLKNNPGETILVDIRYIFTPKKIIEENGGRMRVVRVGHAYITESMNEDGGIFAGESSGHYFFRATGNAESQIPVILTVLNVITKERKKMSEIVKEYRGSYESGEINFKASNAKTIMAALKKKFKGGQLDTLDGIAINYQTWRFSVRSSNTEALTRLNLESYTKGEMEEKRDEIVSFIKSLVDIPRVEG